MLIYGPKMLLLKNELSTLNLDFKITTLRPKNLTTPALEPWLVQYESYQLALVWSGLGFKSSRTSKSFNIWAHSRQTDRLFVKISYYTI